MQRLLLAVSALALGWILLPFYGAILWALIIAVLFVPTYRLLLSNLRQRRNIAAGLVMLLVLVGGVLPFAVVTASLARESMLCNANESTAFAIQRMDGENGYVKDLYFDVDAWVIRYFVLEARSLLSSRNVLLSPMALQEPHWKGRMLKIALTLGQAQGSPSVDFGQSVTNQREAQYLADSGYHVHWNGRGLWGDGIAPSSVVPDFIARRDAIYSSSAFDPDAALDRIWEPRQHEHFSRLGNWTRDEALEGPQ